MSDPYVIVWDLDGTIGEFAALQQLGEAVNPINVQVRPGLAEALQTLSDAGFVHTVLTLAAPLYAEVVLRGSGLRPFFARVEGWGQRGKGDAAGLADVFGVAEDQRPQRMIFVGDHPVYDEPQDPRVLFHLEPCVLTRPAADLARLVLHLRDTGGGSLREGFDVLARQRPWWQRLWPPSVLLPHGIPVRRLVPRVGQLLLMARANASPMIVFEKPPRPEAQPADHTFIPAEVAAQLRAESGKEQQTANPAAE